MRYPGIILGIGDEIYAPLLSYVASVSAGPIGAFAIGLRPDTEMNNAEPRRAIEPLSPRIAIAE